MRIFFPLARFKGSWYAYNWIWNKAQFINKMYFYFKLTLLLFIWNSEGCFFDKFVVEVQQWIAYISFDKLEQNPYEKVLWENQFEAAIVWQL